MKIIKTTFEEVSNLVPNIIINQEETCVYCIADKNCAIVGKNGGANIDIINQLGVQLVEINHEGGTIVASEGDVQIGIFTLGYVGDIYRNEIINRLLLKIKNNGYEPILDNNDILIDGKKVFGFGSRMYGDILYTAIQVSVNIDIDLISKICTKPMRKQPDGLINYGITTEDILEILFNVITGE